MAINDEDEKAENLKSRFSGIHTRTYEAELLISGAVVFGLFRLAPSVSRYFESLEYRLEGQQRMVAIYGQMYLGLVIYALIGAFLLHLIMRAIWIGLVGLESVYPNGVNWQKLKVGPYYKRYSKKRMGPLAQTIERFDDLCSLIFGFGFMIVVVFLYSIIMLLVCATAGILISRLAFGGRFYPQVFWTTFSVILTLQVFPALLDRLFGEKMKRENLLGRVFAYLIAANWEVSPYRWIGQIQFTLQSNTSNTRVSVALITVMFALMLGFLGSIMVREGVLRFDSLTYFPENLRQSGIDPQHYRSMRSGDAMLRTIPSIQTDIIDEPYLKLSIPYYPRRHNPLIRERCPEVEAFKSSGIAFGRKHPPEAAAAQEVINCLASLFSVEVDGKPTLDLDFEFSRENDSGQEAIVTYIPVADFPPGRHEIAVMVPSREMSEGDEGAEPVRQVIPFWR